VTTTLYLLTVATWFNLYEFNGEKQVVECHERKALIEEEFKVKAVCFTKAELVLIVDKRTYRR